MYRNDPELAERLCQGITPGDGVTCEELAAWTMLVSAIYNLDVTKMRS